MLKFRPHQPADPPTARDFIALQDHLREAKVDTPSSLASFLTGSGDLSGQLLQAFKSSLLVDTIVAANTNIPFASVQWGGTQWANSQSISPQETCTFRIHARLTLREREGFSDVLRPGARALMFLVDDAGNKLLESTTQQAVNSLTDLAQIELDLIGDVQLTAGQKYHLRYDGKKHDNTALVTGWQLKRGVLSSLIPGCFVEAMVIPLPS